MRILITSYFLTTMEYWKLFINLKGPLYTFGCTKFLIANVFRTRRSPIYTFCHMRNGKADQKGNIASCNFQLFILLLVTIQASHGFKTK